MGWDTYIVPYGRDTITGIYPLNWAIRSALTFGGLDKGAGARALLYTKDRVHAFGLTLGHVDDIKYATGAGAINLGFPVIADTDIPEIRPTGICTYEHVVHEFDYDQIVPTCIQVRGVKVKVEEVDIPVPYSAAFEGESVRRADMYLEAHQPASIGLEYLRTRELDEIEDGKIEVVGPDFDSFEEGSSINLGVLVEVAGRRMRDDFEPILERQIHSYLNHAMGIFHMGQRNLVWFRLSKETFAKGFRARHLGTILHYGLHNDFGTILDKVQVTIYTNQDDVERLLPEALAAFESRDARLAGLTDEAVDTFYTCTLCQSYAPDHVCIVSPERPGLCGAYSWLDCGAAYEINPHGVNQPVPKGRTLDAARGQWDGVNAAVQQHSHGHLLRFNQYSLMEDPMTSCGCFECIVAIVPEANGIMVVNREYAGMTPLGMKFSTLAGSVGGGNQTPGFLGVGRLYLASAKFISFEGSIKRIVWMPKELKEDLAERLQKRAEEVGEPDLLDKIADETVGTTAEEILPWLMEKNHPALSMEMLF
jgi:acetyl-CoA synthase